MNILNLFKKKPDIPMYPYPCSDIMKQRYDIMIAKAKDQTQYVLVRDRYQISFLNHQTHESYLRANLNLLTDKRFESFMKNYDKLIESLLCQFFLKRKVKVELNDPYQLLQDALNARSSMTDSKISDLFNESVTSKKTEKGRTNGLDYFSRTMVRYMDSLSFENMLTVNSLCGYNLIDIESIKWLRK